MGSVFLSRSYSVLVVDDDPEIIELLRTPLTREGYQVHTAADGDQALAILRQRRVDLILSDVDMPVMNGYELVRQVRRDPTMVEIPFLFFSALGKDENRLHGLELGANDYITKPFLSKEVCLRVRNVLEHQARREERHASMLAATLDLIHLGIVVLGDGTHVTVINRMAREIIDAKDGLLLLENRICGRDPAITRRIERMLSEAQSLNLRFDPTMINPIRIPRPSALRDFSMIALPLDVVQRERDSRALTLVIHDPEVTATPSTELLSNAYQFTKAEARVASLLIQGKAINEICEELEVSRNTVCTHLKRLYMKTDTQRQSDFTRLLLGGLSQLKLD
jgi:DNA-binding response OmpR family regulator/DNA-binding CsgD family transcriptional regulator